MTRVRPLCGFGSEGRSVESQQAGTWVAGEICYCCVLLMALREGWSTGHHQEEHPSGRGCGHPYRGLPSWVSEQVEGRPIPL
jgi:hypothetical protein